MKLVCFKPGIRPIHWQVKRHTQILIMSVKYLFFGWSNIYKISQISILSKKKLAALAIKKLVVNSNHVGVGTSLTK